MCSVVEGLPSIYKALGSIYSTKNKQMKTREGEPTVISKSVAAVWGGKFSGCEYLRNLYSIPGVVVGYVGFPEMAIPDGKKKLELLPGVSRPASVAGRVCKALAISWLAECGRPSLYFSEHREGGAVTRCSSPDGISG